MKGSWVILVPGLELPAPLLRAEAWKTLPLALKKMLSNYITYNEAKWNPPCALLTVQFLPFSEAVQGGVWPYFEVSGR